MVKYPDYSKSIVNVACSVLKHFGLEYTHPTLQVYDDLLSKNYRNVVIMLFDGLGVDALKFHLQKDSFLRRHFKTEISSVFPPTTTAATVSMESGLTPAEHGWLGWSLYFKEINKIVNTFPNTVKGSDEIAADYHVAKKFMPYRSIIDCINETGTTKAYSVSKFGTNYVENHSEMFDEVKRLCNEEGKKYIYTYCEQPDTVMHLNGCYSKEVTTWVQDINKRVEDMCEGLADTLLIVTADHGHINTRYKIVNDYPELVYMLERPIAVESRAACFYVKEEFRERFPRVFKEIFGNDFLLLSKQEVIEQELFGDGIKHKKFEDFIGDYLAIAVKDQGIVYHQNSKQLISNHAGLTELEMMVPFIVVEKR